ncbi:MAG: hypothetical protein ACPGYL_00870, partial [Rhodospirillaceae bacterium]
YCLHEGILSRALDGDIGDFAGVQPIQEFRIRHGGSLGGGAVRLEHLQHKHQEDRNDDPKQQVFAEIQGFDLSVTPGSKPLERRASKLSVPDM